MPLTTTAEFHIDPLLPDGSIAFTPAPADTVDAIRAWIDRNLAKLNADDAAKAAR